MHDRAPRAVARAVITADDMGIRAAWDRAIAGALERGVVTSVSLVTSGASYPDARATLRALGAPDVGVHLDLVSTRPLSPAREVPSLVDPAGGFPGSWRQVVARYLLGRLAPGEVALEWERQIRRAVDDGLAPTHLNAHYHLHMLPGLFRVAAALAERFGILHVRVPDEPPLAGGLGAAAAAPKVALLWLLGRGASRPRAGERVRCRGVGGAGRLGADRWERLLRELPAGVTEVICHPGQSAEEDAALRSEALRAELGRRARLTSFGELRAHGRGAPLCPDHPRASAPPAATSALGGAG